MLSIGRRPERDPFPELHVLEEDRGHEGSLVLCLRVTRIDSLDDTIDRRDTIVLEAAHGMIFLVLEQAHHLLKAALEQLDPMTGLGIARCGSLRPDGRALGAVTTRGLRDEAVQRGLIIF